MSDKGRTELTLDETDRLMALIRHAPLDRVRKERLEREAWARKDKSAIQSMKGEHARHDDGTPSKPW